MTPDRALLERECQLRLVEHIEANLPTSEPLDLWIDGFWAAVEAIRKPRLIEDVEAAINMRRSLQARQQEQRHANYRPRSSASAATRRKNDAAAAELTAYLSEAHRPQRDRGGA